MGRIHRIKGRENMNNYNPMNLFDNKQPMFNTPEGKQSEYLYRVEKLIKLKNELYKLWQDQRKK